MSKVLVTSADGRTWWGCECLEAWWPWTTRMAVHRGLVFHCLDVTQGCYSANSVAASAGTHNGGGVLDISQHGGQVDDLLEEMGAAAFERTPAQGFSFHTHLILIGCPHADPSAAAQVRDWRARRDGLARHGPDPDQTRPDTIRTWSEGVAWAKARLQVVVAPPEPPTPPPTEDEMVSIDKVSPDVIQDLASAIGAINFAGRKPLLEVLQINAKLDELITAQQAMVDRLDTLIAALSKPRIN